MQRKVFRIEQMMAGSGERRRIPTPPAISDRELIELHDLVARHKRDLSALIHDGEHRRMTVAASELGAAVESMEKATHDILKSAESIEASARLLGASAKSDRERVLTSDIQNQIAKMYEACNFQDLAGQRIGKVIEMLVMIESQLAAMLGQNDAGSRSLRSEDGLINGPKLDGASGHVSQHDIDMLFG